MIKQIGLPLRGRPILLITRMITDRIGLHSVLLPLQISPNRMRKYYSGEILFCGVLRRYVSQNREFKSSLRTTDYGNTRRGPGSRFTAHAR